MAARPQLPGMRWFLWLRIASLRIGILTGIYLSCVFVAWLVVANRVRRSWSLLPKRAISWRGALLITVLAIPVLAVPAGSREACSSRA